MSSSWYYVQVCCRDPLRGIPIWSRFTCGEKRRKEKIRTNPTIIRPQPSFAPSRSTPWSFVGWHDTVLFVEQLSNYIGTICCMITASGTMSRQRASTFFGPLCLEKSLLSRIMGRLGAKSSLSVSGQALSKYQYSRSIVSADRARVGDS